MNSFLKDLNFQSYIKNRYSQNIIVDNEQIIWNVEKECVDNIDTILNWVMNDYDSSLKNCKEAVDNYLNCNINDSSRVENLIGRFYRSLKFVHPYFATDVLSNDKNILPYQYILIEQILDALALKYITYTDAPNIKGDVKELIQNYVQPVFKEINDKNYSIHNIKDEFCIKLNQYFSSFEARHYRYMDEHRAEDDLIKDLIGVNSKNNEIIQPLDSIKKSLDNLKDFAYLMTLYKSDINTSYIMQLFKSKLPKKLKMKYNNITIENVEKINFEETKEIVKCIKDVNKEILFARIEKLNEEHQKNENIKYRINCFEQLTFICFEFMLNFNKKMSLCHNCRKVFIAERSNVKYCKRCKKNGTNNVYEKNSIVRKIKKRFDDRISREKSGTQNDKEKQFNIQKLKDYSEEWETEAKKIIENNNFNKNSIVNRLEYMYDNLIEKYNKEVKIKIEPKRKYPIMYIEPVYDLKVKNDSYMAYVIFVINEKGLFRALDDVRLVENQKEYFGKDCWFKIFNKLRENSVKNIGILFSENIEAIKEAVKEVFPKTDIQLNILPLISDMMSEVIHEEKSKFCNDLLSIYKLPEKSDADKILRRIDGVWDIKHVKKWIDNWDDISPAFEYSPIVRIGVCKNSIIENFHSKFNSNDEYSSIEELILKLQEAVDDTVAKEYLTPLNNWDEILKELKAKRKSNIKK